MTLASMLFTNLSQHCAQPWNHVTDVTVMALSNMARQLRKRRFGPPALVRAGTLAVLLQPIEYRLGGHVGAQTSFLQRFAATAAIVDTRIFENPPRPRIRKRNLVHSCFYVEVHSRPPDGDHFRGSPDETQ